MTENAHKHSGPTIVLLKDITEMLWSVHLANTGQFYLTMYAEVAILGVTKLTVAFLA